MNTLVGALLGGAAALGILVAVLGSPPLRRTSLADRIAPYLGDTPRPSRLLTGAPASGTSSAVVVLLRPVVRDIGRVIDRLLGGRQSVERRLAALGSDQTVDGFRVEQVLWGAIGAGGAVALALFAVFLGQSSPVALLLLIAVAAVSGVLARDWWLTREVDRQDREILAEFPVIAEMLALAVAAGEGPVGAIDRITRLAHGPLIDQLAGVLAAARSGTPLLTALGDLRDRTRLEPLARFLDGMAVAIERGTPLSDVLRAQAADARAVGKRELLESGGRREIAMMIPVVFLVLPVTIVFALYPGLVAIQTVAR